jgi:hypothetical protein
MTSAGLCGGNAGSSTKSTRIDSSKEFFDMSIDVERCRFLTAAPARNVLRVARRNYPQ